MRVIVTRPARDAVKWVQAMASRGLNAVGLPLIDVGPVDHPERLIEAWQRIGDFAGVMFVSGNAVEYFFNENSTLAPVHVAPSAIKMRAFATGPGTVQALVQAGVEPLRIEAPSVQSGQYDSEALWRLVGETVRAGQRFLIVRGQDHDGAGASDPDGDGRDWFSDQLRRAGALVETVAAYQRRVPVLSSGQRELAKAAAIDGSVWVLSSSQAIGNLLSLMPDQDWSMARAVATHARIADRARGAGFGVVCESRPALDDVVASIESLHEL